jgi:hypothetical protein
MHGSRFRPWPEVTLIAISALILVTSSAVRTGGVFEGPTVEAEALPMACAAVVAVVPGVNSSLFLEVCTEPSFAAALASYGVQNFSYGWESLGGQIVLYGYSFLWTGACPPTSLTSGSGLCAYQESWEANATSGNVSGPYLHVGPAACTYCPADILAPPGFDPIVIVFALVFGAASVVAIRIVWTHRRRPPSMVTNPGTDPHIIRPPD